MRILPSRYVWLLPIHVDLNIVDQLALKGEFPTLEGLWPALMYCILFGVARMILQRVLFTPLAMAAMRIKFHPEPENRDIDDLLRRKGKKKGGIAPITMDKVQEICRKEGKSVEEVRQMIRHKRHNKSARLKLLKFSEALWRLIFYTSFVALGYVALFLPETASWIIDTKNHWRDWPHHPISEAVKFYLMIELGCYMHQLMWTEVSRSDAAEMIAHHLITICLITFAWLMNFSRIGASILLVHDISDVFLESAKLCNYASKVKAFKKVSQFLTDSLFATFAITFLITRLIVYPRYLVYSLVFESRELWGGPWPGYWPCAVLLCALMCLHIFWFYLIFTMVIKLFAGGIQKDERSDDEQEVTIEGDDSKSVGSQGSEVKTDKRKQK